MHEIQKLKAQKWDWEDQKHSQAKIEECITGKMNCNVRPMISYHL